MQCGPIDKDGWPEDTEVAMKEAMFCAPPPFEDRPESLAAAAAWAVQAGVAPNVAVAFSTATGVDAAAGDADAFFDLASITKSFCAVACIHAGLPLATPVAEVLPALSQSPVAHTPLLWLLSHRAGLVDHVPLFLPFLEDARATARPRAGLLPRGEARLMVASRLRADRGEPDPAFGFPPIYSDLGYFLAGEMLASYTGMPDAGAAIRATLLEPLGLADALGTAGELRLDERLPRVVPTEFVPWRGGDVHGRVHDENAFVLEGWGGAGHAGLFGTAPALASFGRLLLEAAGDRGPLAHRNFKELLTVRPGGTLRAGFDGKSTEGSSAGLLAGPNTFGHLGFTGTSLWIDPDLGVATVFLTNRVSPTRASTHIRRARPIVHDLLFTRGIAADRGRLHP
jgi:CubicO group peptidase (beta-lactamase class C family)